MGGGGVCGGTEEPNTRGFPNASDNQTSQNSAGATTLIKSTPTSETPGWSNGGFNYRRFKGCVFLSMHPAGE